MTSDARRCNRWDAFSRMINTLSVNGPGRDGSPLRKGAEYRFHSIELGLFVSLLGGLIICSLGRDF